MATVDDADEDADGRVVRTTLAEGEYEEFQRLATGRDQSVEEALREAVRERVEFHDELESLLETVDGLDESVGERTDASEMDADLYGSAAEDAGL